MTTTDELREAVARIIDPDAYTANNAWLIFSAREEADRMIRLVVDACAAVADERAAICKDAVEKIEAGTLYRGLANAKETEQCARLEALHIARLIRALAPKEPAP